MHLSRCIPNLGTIVAISRCVWTWPRPHAFYHFRHTHRSTWRVDQIVRRDLILASFIPLSTSVTTSYHSPPYLSTRFSNFLRTVLQLSLNLTLFCTTFHFCLFRNANALPCLLSPIYRTFFRQVDRRWVTHAPRTASTSISSYFIFFDYLVRALCCAIRHRNSFSAVHTAQAHSHALWDL